MLIASYFPTVLVRTLSKEWNGDVSASLLLLFLFPCSPPCPADAEVTARVNGVRFQNIKAENTCKKGQSQFCEIRKEIFCGLVRSGKSDKEGNAPIDLRLL